MLRRRATRRSMQRLREASIRCGSMVQSTAGARRGDSRHVQARDASRDGRGHRFRLGGGYRRLGSRFVRVSRIPLRRHDPNSRGTAPGRDDVGISRSTRRPSDPATPVPVRVRREERSRIRVREPRRSSRRNNHMATRSSPERRPARRVSRAPDLARRRRRGFRSARDRSGSSERRSGLARAAARMNPSFFFHAARSLMSASCFASSAVHAGASLSTPSGTSST